MHETILKLLQTVENLEKRIELLEKASRANTDEITAINNSMVHAMMQRIIMSKQLERVKGALFGRNYWQEICSPALSGNTAAEVPAEHRSTCTRAESADSANATPKVPAEPSTSIPSETPVTEPMATPGESGRTAPIQTDAPTHFQEEPLWEHMLNTCRRTARQEAHGLILEALQEIAKRSNEAS